jgi:hypothetical protein
MVAAAAAIHALHHIYCRMQLHIRAERFESMKECSKVTQLLKADVVAS